MAVIIGGDRRPDHGGHPLGQRDTHLPADSGAGLAVQVAHQVPPAVEPVQGQQRLH